MALSAPVVAGVPSFTDLSPRGWPPAQLREVRSSRSQPILDRWAASDPAPPSKAPVRATLGSQAPDCGPLPVDSLPLGPIQTGDERGVSVKPLAEGLLAASAACATSAPEARASTARACFGSGLSAWRIISASDHVTLTWLAPMFTWRVGRPNLRTWASVRTADKNLAWALSIFRY